MTRGSMGYLVLGAGMLAGSLVLAPLPAVAESPAAGADIGGKNVYLRKLSVLRHGDSYVSKIYTLTKVTLEVKGRGPCTQGWCPLTHNKVDLFARRSHVDLTKPADGMFVTERTLRRGDEGEDVKAIQQVLVKKGYSTVTVDGKYGQSTVAAVSDFQKKNGLNADGTVGPQTRAKLVG